MEISDWFREIVSSIVVRTSAGSTIFFLGYYPEGEKNRDDKPEAKGKGRGCIRSYLDFIDTGMLPRGKEMVRENIEIDVEKTALVRGDVEI